MIAMNIIPPTMTILQWLRSVRTFVNNDLWHLWWGPAFWWGPLLTITCDIYLVRTSINTDLWCPWWIPLLTLTCDILGEDLGHNREVLAADTGQTGGLGEDHGHMVTQQQGVLPQQGPRPQQLQLCNNMSYTLSTTENWPCSYNVNSGMKFTC